MIKRQHLRTLKQSVQYHTQRTLPLIKGKISANGIKAFWYRKTLNFGDLITPWLLQHFGYTPIFTRPADAQLVSTGSILEFLTDNFSGVIIGSGFVEPGPTCALPKANILSVRGELTRERLDLPSDLPLGDPGLLFGRLTRRKEAQGRVGYIPHYAEKNTDLTKTMLRRENEGLLVIDPQDLPDRVAEKISQCNFILSSSLHGLIIADSMGIPTGWVESTNVVGGQYKFNDYYSSLGCNCQPAGITGDETIDELTKLTDLKPQDEIRRRQDELEQIWKNLNAVL